MISAFLMVIFVLAVSAEIPSVQERWDFGNTMVVVLCFQESNHLRSLIVCFVFKKDLFFHTFQDNELVL